MQRLIVDIGNTDTKICIINSNFKILTKINFNTYNIKKINFIKKKIKLLIKNKKIYKTVFFSSVVPTAFNIFKNILKKKFKFNSLEVKDINFKKLIKIKANEKQSGSDRIANAIGSYYNYQSDCVVLDFGTATTFDVVVDGIYKGGVIAPGLSLSLNNLVSKAEQLPFFTIKKSKKVIGTNTVSALRSGFFWGYVGLIDNIITLIKKESKKKLIVILTGGFSHLFKDAIKSKAFIDEDITIKGLIQIAKNDKHLNTYE